MVTMERDLPVDRCVVFVGLAGNGAAMPIASLCFGSADHREGRRVTAWETVGNSLFMERAVCDIVIKLVYCQFYNYITHTPRLMERVERDQGYQG
jgi:hypothetical protein